MRAFRNAFEILIMRPVIIILVSLVTFLFCVVEFKNPILSLIFGFSRVAEGDIFKSIISVIQFVFNFIISNKMSLTVLLLLLLLGVIIVVSAFIGFMISGCSNIINNTLEGKPKYKGEFWFGVRKYFAKLYLITLRVSLFGIAYAIFIVILTIPAIVITEAYISGKSQFLLATIFVDIITVGVLFFSLMFFRIYMFFWYPAAVSHGKKAFIEGKNITDENFWGIVANFLIFDIVFVVLESVFIYLNYILKPGLESPGAVFGVALFIGNWIFKTLFFTSFIVYIYTAYKTYKLNKVQ